MATPGLVKMSRSPLASSITAVFTRFIFPGIVQKASIDRHHIPFWISRFLECGFFFAWEMGVGHVQLRSTVVVFLSHLLLRSGSVSNLSS